MLFCDISRAEQATPPALAALAGPNNTPAPCNSAIASNDVGILAPSETTFVPLAINTLADSKSSSPCVAHGRAISHLIFHIPLHPS